MIDLVHGSASVTLLPRSTLHFRSERSTVQAPLASRSTNTSPEDLAWTEPTLEGLVPTEEAAPIEGPDRRLPK
jgi:hypothetical protein